MCKENCFIDPYEKGIINATYADHLDGFSVPEKAIAVAMHEDIDILMVEEGYTENYFTAAGRKYWVLTDEEADEAWNEDMDNYIDECLELPEQIEPYFDRERWKDDAKMDGRAHSLARYDGIEHSENVNEHTYYIYRV